MELKGILFALLTTLSWSFCIFPFTVAARKMGANALNHFRLPLAATVLAIAALIIDPNAFTGLFVSFVPKAWFWLSLSGIIGLVLGDYFAFGAFSILGARRGSVLNTLAPPATLLLAALIVNEKMNVTGIIGIFITVIGVMSISLGKKERIQIPDHGHGPIVKGIIFGILSAFCQGAGLVMAKKGIAILDIQYRTMCAIHHTFMRMIAASLSLYIFSLISGQLKGVVRQMKNNSRHTFMNAVAGTTFGPILGVCLSLYTITMLNVSVAQTIFSLVPVLAMFIAYFYYKERISLQSIIGTITAIAGVTILIWRDDVAAWVSNHL